MRSRLTSLLSTRAARWARVAGVVLCLLLAAVAALSTSKPAPAGAGRPSSDVVVAATTLPAGHVVAPSDFLVARWPTALRPHDAITRIADVTGRRLAAPLARGEPLTRPRLLGSDLAAGLDPGTVATPITVDADIGHIVQAGDRVDVLAAALPSAGVFGSPSPKHSDTTTRAAVVARQVLVLAVLGTATDAASAGIQTRVVIAADRPLALRLAGFQAVRSFTVVLDAP